MDPSGIRKSEASCLVCGDKASGRHYGVPSCDGCRGFFKRSIRRNLDYVCKESNQCVVDVSRRNQCQACRFRKCLAVNMKREAVQHERAPRGALKRAFPQQFHLAAASATSSIGDTPFSGGLTFPTFYPGPVRFPWRPQYQSLLQHQRQLPVRFGPLLGDTLPLTANPLYSLLQQNDTAPNPAPKTDLKEDEVSSSANEHEEATPENEPPKTVDAPPSTQQKNSGSGNSSEILRRQIAPLSIDFRSMAMENQPSSNNVSESAARLLFMAVRWARSIPSFTQLSYRDQTTLLEASWCELFVLNAAQWGLVLEEAIGAYSSTSERHTDELEELLRLRDLIARFHLLHVDHTEYACLKALVLFKPETRGLRDPLTVELLQDQTHLMLHEYCTSQSTNLTLVGTRHSLPARFGKLLLLLPIVRTVQSSTLMEVFFRNTVGNVPMEKLLTDLLSTC